MRIKRERYSPYATVCIKPELLHVRVLGPIQGIHARSLCPRSELLDHFRLREQLVLDRYRESIELELKFVGKFDDPRHEPIMASIPYVVNTISVGLHELRQMPLLLARSDGCLSCGLQIAPISLFRNNRLGCYVPNRFFCAK